MSTKSPADRALLNGQLSVVPVTSREKLAVESILSRTQRGEAEHHVQLRHDLVETLSTKSPADRTLLNDQDGAAPVPSRGQLAIGSIPSRTQRDEAEHHVQLRHNFVDALSMKSPADRTLLNDQLEVIPVLSCEQLAVELIPSRTQRDEEEHRARLHHDLVDASSTKSPADRALVDDQLEVVPVPSRENAQLSRSQVEHNKTQRSTVSSFVITSSTPCRRSRQLIKPY